MNDVDHYEPEDSGGSGIGLLVLGALMIWGWGFAAGLFVHWIFFTK